MTQIAFLLYPDLTALDAALPLTIEYDPDPPFDSGSVETADEETRRRATEMMVPSGDEPQAAP